MEDSILCAKVSKEEASGDKVSHQQSTFLRHALFFVPDSRHEAACGCLGTDGRITSQGRLGPLDILTSSVRAFAFAVQLRLLFFYAARD